MVTSMESIITAKDLFFRYREEADDVLRGVDFELKAGEWLAILGGNGSGKSTLAKMMNGLIKPNRGSIQVLGLSPLNEKDLPLIRQKVGMVFQNPENQIVGSTVEDDIAFGLENIGLPPGEIDRRIDQVLEQMRLTPFRYREPHRLSGGQKQRLAIAGILAIEPEVIIFDEASSMLDPEGAYELLEIMRELHGQGISIIQITHDLEETRDADRLLIMKEGRLITTGEPEEILSDSQLLAASSLTPPFAVRIHEQLARAGIHIPRSGLDERKLADNLWRYGLKK